MLITSAHVPLAELSHMTTLTARDAGKCNQAVCPGGRGSGFGEHFKPSSSGANFPGPSNGPASLKFLGTAHSAKTTITKKRLLCPCCIFIISSVCIPFRGHLGTSGLWALWIDLTVKIKKNEWKRKKQKQEQRGLSSSGFENRPPVGRKRPQVQGWQRPEHREMSGEDKEPLLGEPESSREKG